MNQDKFSPFTSRLRDLLRRSGLSCRVDDSGVSIGRRYARMDEVGVPFAITIDHTTIDDDTVTLRERDSTSQVRTFHYLKLLLPQRCACRSACPSRN
jgi:glycyl-tRNA synthetase